MSFQRDETAWRHPRAQGRRSRACVARDCGLGVRQPKDRAGRSFSSRWPGAKDDGLKHVGEAVAKGAAAIVAERWAETPNAAFVKVADARAALAHAAARFYPRQPETIVAVTGTSGKTSVAAFVRQIWRTLGTRGRFDRNDRRRVAPAHRLRIADDAGPDRAASSFSIGLPRTASPTSRSRPPRTASTRSGSTACASPRPRSPI